jgi:hypothetical protein
LAWASGLEAVLQKIHPGATLDAGGLHLVHELVMQAFEAIVDAARRAASAQPAGKRPSFIESCIPSRAEYEVWLAAEEAAAEEEAAAAASAGSTSAAAAGVTALRRPTRHHVIALLDEAIGTCLSGCRLEGLAKYALLEGRKAVGPESKVVLAHAATATALAARLDGRHEPASAAMEQSPPPPPPPPLPPPPPPPPPPAALRTAEAAQYLTGVVEYLASELLELAGNCCRDRAVRRRWKDTDQAEEAMQFAREASQLRAQVRADPAGADAAVTAAVDALAVVRDADDEDDESLFEDVRDEEEPVRRSDVLLAIGNDEELSSLWGYSWHPEKFAECAALRLSVAGDAEELAVLKAIMCNGTPAERAREAEARAAFER